MFGILRTILAVMVLVGHLTDQWQIGTYAVFAFYMISGYLMTHIMHEAYGFTLDGQRRFALNRFIRLYPGYWFVLLLTLGVLAVVGAEFAVGYNELIYMPSSVAEWLSVLSMVYVAEFPNKVAPNLAPTTWAITVELFFYLCICLGLSKTKLRVAIWLFLSLAYVVYCQVAGVSWPYKYFPIPAASLPFAIGAFIYFRKKEGFISISDSWVSSPATLTALLIGNAIATLIVPEYFQTGFYVSFFISILLCYEIAMDRRWPVVSAKVDKLIGDYSYPIYLMHWQVGLVLAYLIYGEPVKDATSSGYTVAIVSLLICVLIATIIIRFVDRPLERLKAKRLRSGVEQGN